MKIKIRISHSLLFGLGLGLLMAVGLSLQYFFSHKNLENPDPEIVIQQESVKKPLEPVKLSKTEIAISSACKTFPENRTNPEILEISFFKPVRELCKLKNSNSFFLAIRSFQIRESAYRLLVDSKTLETQVIDSRCLNCVQRTTSSGNFARALEKFNQPRASNFFNPGLQSAPINGIFLTADLCPTNQKFELHALETLARLQKNSEPARSEEIASLPIGLAVSGSWLKHHLKELHWLKTKISEKSFQITWINHSYLHPYNKDLPLNETFYLTKDFDSRKDILRNESTLLSYGLVPSIFFRFPGLYADKQLLEIATELELITLGAGTWANQKRSPRNGDIYLFHANGNEPEGAQQLIRWIENRTVPRPFLPLESIFSSIE